MSAEERKVRLQKFISDCGVCSRRKAEELILQGRVKVNDEVVTVLGTKVDPHDDVIFVDGQLLDLNAIEQLYVLLHKPRGYMTTLDDPEGRKTVMDLVKEFPERIYPVGRLDYLSEGLLIMTNDGVVANLVMHPRYEVIKVYEVKVFGAVDEKILSQLRKGTEVDGVKVAPKSVRVIEQLPNKTWLEFRLGEGRNREIRRICEDCNVTIDKLRRVAIAGLTIEGIKPGGYRVLSRNQLLRALGMKSDGSPTGEDVEYKSPKTTINLKQKGAQFNTTLATDDEFKKFRKDSYYKTAKQIQQNRKELGEKAETEAYAIREERHQERKQKKERREQAKSGIAKPKIGTRHGGIKKNISKATGFKKRS